MSERLSIYQETQIVQQMKLRNRPVRAILNGTQAISKSNENKNGDSEPSIAEYIPKEPQESKDTYNNRLLRTYVTPYTKNAIESAAGQIFKNPVTIKTKDGTDLDQRLLDVLSNVDMLGSDFNQWLMNSTIDSLSYGMSIAYGGFYNPTQSKNLSEQINSGARPFVKQISYFDLLGYSFDEAGRVTMLRFLEEAEIDNDFYGSDRIKQVRVVRPTSYEVYQEERNSHGYEIVESGEIERFDESNQQITDHIPIVVMYGNKLGTLESASVFEDMAYININHTQVSSDLGWSSHFNLVPFLLAIISKDLTGSEGEVQTALSTLSSYNAITLPEGSDMKWVETDGRAHEAGQKHLADIERRISESKMDSSVSVNSGAKETATGRAIDASATSAKLKLHAEAVESYAKGIIEMLSSFMPDVSLQEFDVIANKDFSVSLDGQSVKNLSDMVSLGQLSLETFLFELKRRGELADDVDVPEEMERIATGQAVEGLIA